jgi:hypothetical protein
LEHHVLKKVSKLLFPLSFQRQMGRKQAHARDSAGGFDPVQNAAFLSTDIPPLCGFACTLK